MESTFSKPACWVSMLVFRDVFVDWKLRPTTIRISHDPSWSPLLGHCRQFLWRGGSLIGHWGEEVYFLGHVIFVLVGGTYQPECLHSVGLTGDFFLPKKTEQVLGDKMSLFCWRKSDKNMTKMKLGFGFGVFVVAIREYLTKKWALSVRSCEAFIGDPKIGRRHCQKNRGIFQELIEVQITNDIPNCSSFDLRIKTLDDFAILRSHCHWFLSFLHEKIVTWRVPDPCAFLMTFRTRILKWGWTWNFTGLATIFHRW